MHEKLEKGLTREQGGVYFWVGADDGLTASSVWLFGVGPKEVGLFGVSSRDIGRARDWIGSRGQGLAESLPKLLGFNLVSRFGHGRKDRCSHGWD